MAFVFIAVLLIAVVVWLVYFMGKKQKALMKNPPQQPASPAGGQPMQQQTPPAQPQSPASPQQPQNPVS